MLVDLHQHVWSRQLLDALQLRTCAPFVRRDDELTVLHCPGELPYVIDETAQGSVPRSELLATDGVERAVMAISSPIGIEVLARDAAAELISAHLDGVLGLGEEFLAWGPIPVAPAAPADVEAVLARGCVGVSVPASVLADRSALQEIMPVLEHVQAIGTTLFVHPGGFAPRQAPLDEPLWWAALADYVPQMQAAWMTFAAFGRRELPGLRVLFAMLAGGAPLQSERLLARGGPALDLHDPLTFYDTSSYGPMAIEAMVSCVGCTQLVYGSDRPVIEPVITGREVELMINAAKLLAPAGAFA